MYSTTFMILSLLNAFVLVQGQNTGPPIRQNSVVPTIPPVVESLLAFFRSKGHAASSTIWITSKTDTTGSSTILPTPSSADTAIPPVTVVTFMPSLITITRTTDTTGLSTILPIVSGGVTDTPPVTVITFEPSVASPAPAAEITPQPPAPPAPPANDPVPPVSQPNPPITDPISTFQTIAIPASSSLSPSSPSPPASSLTPTSSSPPLISSNYPDPKANPGDMLICTDTDYTGDCTYLHSVTYLCQNLPEKFQYNLTSAQPDKNQLCILYAEPDCYGADSWLRWPGTTNLRGRRFDNRAVSWRCMDDDCQGIQGPGGCHENPDGTPKGA